jgi:pimeloyl-ACP methyl ester carboxylesterase
MARLVVPPAKTRDEAIAAGIASAQVIGSPEHFDEDRVRARSAASFDRAFNPAGTARQLFAIASSGSRAEGLQALRVPTLVIHGDIDPLVTVSGGRRTAELVPDAELLVLEGMGHDLPRALWPQIFEAITANTRRAT